MIFLPTLFLLLIIILIYVILQTAFSVDCTSYDDYIKRLHIDDLNDPIKHLKDVRGIVNLPNININSSSIQENESAKCADEALFLGEVDEKSIKQYEDECVNKCTTSSSILVINEGEEYYFHDKLLQTGVWCVPHTFECNLPTGYVVYGLQGPVCKSKFPRCFGGALATKVIACKDESYTFTNSILWDNLHNVRVDPMTIEMTDEDEKLPGGEYRFTCQYSNDEIGNKLQDHPLDRLHPTKNRCVKNVPSAHPSAGMKVDEIGWYCDCGKFEDTRLLNEDPHRMKSTCTPYPKTITEVNYSTFDVKTPYKCWNIMSPITDLVKSNPCINVTEVGINQDTITLRMADQSDYANDKSTGVFMNHRNSEENKHNLKTEASYWT